VKRLFLALLLLANSAYGQSSSPSAPPPKPAFPPAPSAAKPAASVAPDEGTINGRLYTSDYFGFRYTLPEDFVADEDPADGEEDASHRSFVLLSAYGSGERRGSVMVILADQAVPTGTAEASAYLTKVAIEVMKRKGFLRQDPVRRVTLGGRSFAAADFARGENAQSVYVTMQRGYALNFVLMGRTRAEVEKMAASLASLQFTPAVKPRTAPASPPSP